ncbi:glycine-tRNA synthetase subunit beta [Salmonella enterica subsp. arizonae]|uniref:Glycine--tRNA ligase beta subunit n=1 Tax=Salmonella enterica subsp. arizonae TaxID=59203 RepID=A0A379T4B2_SALER|nr:glycine-tRNA synthetase subunit beta [Salmonella enterica subsp. arizonae]
MANLAESQPDREVEKRGPAIAQAFDAEGKPSKAAEGWARGCGITVDQAERLKTGKGEWLLYRAHVKGESTEALVPNMVATSLAKLPIPKLMRWGASDVHFVRPVHTVTLLLGDNVIPATILGIQSDRVIRGHRFMGEPEFTIDTADQYPQILLERGKVIADYEARKAKIKSGCGRGGAQDWRQCRPERKPAGRSRLAGGMAGGIDGEIRRKIPRCACRSAGVHHEGRPEVFPGL